MKKIALLAAAALLTAALTGCSSAPADGDTPVTTALADPAGTPTAPAKPETTAPVSPLQAEMDAIAAMTPDEIDVTFFSPAYELYNGFAGLGFYKDGEAYTFDAGDTVDSEWGPMERLVSPFATYDEYMTALRERFTDEVIAQFTEGGKLLTESNGKAYVLQAGRGVNLMYLDTVYTVKDCDYERQTVTFTATNRYIKDEYFDQVEDRSDLPEEYTYTATGEFTCVKRGDNWVFADFMPFDRIGLAG